MTEESSNYLFVYGTLKRTYKHAMHERMRTFVSYVGEGTCQGELFRIDWYPGMVSSDDEADKVIGEVYEILEEKPLFKLLDKYEGYFANSESSSDYLRRKVNVKHGSQTVQAWAYLYNLPTNDLEKITSGIFAS
jgi:pyruvate carboxylase